ncbi:MAG TPA: Crp/Fnr family transcriptional regulator [Bacillota bacterium]|nr:Crp/Fnr family transcriptional regulator [Bacillota bacterium]
MGVGPDVAARIQLFASLPAAALGAVADQMHVRHYRRRMLIFSVGEPVEVITFVLAGTVRIFRDTADGHEQTLQLLRDGDTLNLAGVTGDAPYAASAETVTDCEIGQIRCPDFAAVVRAHGDLAWALIEDLTRRLRWSQGRIFDFALRSASGRVASALLQLAERDGKPLPDGRFILDMPLTHRELGQLAGISRETATRMLQQLRESDAIRWTEDGFVIVDRAKMGPWLTEV